MIDYKKYINEVQDFPKEGISFKDISPLLSDRAVFKKVIDEMGNLVASPARVFHLSSTWMDVPDYWVGIDSRGFIFASALSYAFGGGVVMCRKANKLPPTVLSYSYKTEYSEDTLQIKQGNGKVVIVDDVLATGGTMAATDYLCKTAGYDVVDHLVLIDLKYIPLIEHSAHLGKFNLEVKSLVEYGE